MTGPESIAVVFLFLLLIMLAVPLSCLRAGTLFIRALNLPPFSQDGIKVVLLLRLRRAESVATRTPLSVTQAYGEGPCRKKQWNRVASNEAGRAGHLNKDFVRVAVIWKVAKLEAQL